MNRTMLRNLVLLMIVLVTGLTLAGLVRGFGHARRIRDRTVPTIRPWMPIPVIADVYHVAPNVVQTALGLPAQPPDRRPLSQIARAQGRTPDDLIRELETKLHPSKPSAPTGPPPVSPTPGEAP